MRNRAGTPSPVSGPDRPLAQALALGDVLEPDGLERLVRARTVESTAVLSASSRPPRASAGSVRYPPRAVGLAAGVAVGLPGRRRRGHGELVYLAVDSAGRFVGAGRRNRPLRCRYWDCASARAPRLDGSPAALAVCGPHTGCRARRRSRCRETTPPLFPPPWPRSRACRFRP